MPETRWPLVGRGEELSRADGRAGGRAGGSNYRPGRSRQDHPRHDVPAAGPRPGDVGGPHDRHSCFAAAAVRGAGADPAPDPGVDRLSRDGHGQLLRFYARAVTARAGGRPLVVFVDDAHLLDDGSATLVHHLALTQDGYGPGHRADRRASARLSSGHVEGRHGRAHRSGRSGRRGDRGAAGHGAGRAGGRGVRPPARRP